MNELVLFVGLLINTCTITAYQSLKSQTDASPNYTSIGDKTHRGGIAVSRNLLKRFGGTLDYGDYVYVEGLGIYEINDCMGLTQYDKIHHKRIPIKDHFDIWVSNIHDERKIGVQHRKVYLLTRKIHGY